MKKKLRKAILIHKYFMDNHWSLVTFLDNIFFFLLIKFRFFKSFFKILTHFNKEIKSFHPRRLICHYTKKTNQINSHCSSLPCLQLIINFSDLLILFIYWLRGIGIRFSKRFLVVDYHWPNYFLSKMSFNKLVIWGYVTFGTVSAC